ncbi:MAG: ROK family protein [Bacteroidota bacterium]
MPEKQILGIDVGGTSMKGGLVDPLKGEMVTERKKILTPQPATPKAMAKVFKELVEFFDYSGPVGVGFPSVIQKGVARSATNLDKAWIGTSIEKTFGKHVDGRVFAVNDADAAGLAEMEFGAGADYHNGTVILITIGTGLGAGLFIDGKLVPNMEFGSMYLRDMKVIAERFVSNKVRKDEELSWKDFGKRFNIYLKHIERIFSPDTIILGGGASKSFDSFKPELTDVEADIMPAQMLNKAGTVGAAIYANQKMKG